MCSFAYNIYVHSFFTEYDKKDPFSVASVDFNTSSTQNIQTRPPFPTMGSSIFNPIALRKAKIVYNFDLSECNRVKFEHAYLCYKIVGKLQTLIRLLCICGLI